MTFDKLIVNIISKIFLPELSTKIVVNALRFGAAPLIAKARVSNRALSQNLFNVSFDNPLGMAAGFDKNATAYSGLFKLGFGFIEVGSVTLEPQLGNTADRKLWSLKEDRAVINCFGLPSDGLAKVRRRVLKNKETILGVNIVNNKNSLNIYEDYESLARAFADCVSYLAINVSCPNVDSSENLQSSAYLPKILQAVKRGIDGVNSDLPIIIKLSPDTDSEELSLICDYALKYNVSAMIIGNTTNERPLSLQSKNKTELGGLSGVPLFASSTAKLAEAYLLCAGAMPLIGVGGIGSAEDAYKKIKAGANLLQLYTALYYEGVGLIPSILSGLLELLEADGYDHISQAVGVEAETYSKPVL